MSNPKGSPSLEEEKKRKAEEKARRKAEFDAKKGLDVSKKDENKNLSKAQLSKIRRDKQEADRAAKNSMGISAVPPSTVAAAATATAVPVKQPVHVVASGGHKKPLTTLETSKAPAITITTNTATLLPSAISAIRRTAGSRSMSKDAKLAVTYDATSKNKVEKSPGCLTFPDIRSRADQETLHKITLPLGFEGKYLHPSIVRYGIQVNRLTIKGCTARNLGLMNGMRDLIADYKVPEGKSFSRDLPPTIRKHMDFVDTCRPLSIGNQNVSSFLMKKLMDITEVELDQSDEDIRAMMLIHIDKFMDEEVICALKGIMKEASDLIEDNDVIMTFGYSVKMHYALDHAREQNKIFSVIVVDSGPTYDGLKMIELMAAMSIPTTYLYINSVSHVMADVTKVMVGAQGILANGYVMARMGCSQLSLVAHANNVPVLVLIETSEFSESVPTDAFVMNEAGIEGEYFKLRGGDFMARMTTTIPRKVDKYLSVLNLKYDLTPPQYVSMLVTERGILPCSAVGAVIRIRSGIK